MLDVMITLIFCFVNRNHFRDVLHNGLGMTDAYMMERVMVALDRGTSPHVTMATFIKAMSLYLRGDLEERIQYAFTVSIYSKENKNFHY